MQGRESRHPVLVFGVDCDLQRHNSPEVFLKKQDVAEERRRFGHILNEATRNLDAIYADDAHDQQYNRRGEDAAPRRSSYGANGASVFREGYGDNCR